MLNPNEINVYPHPSGNVVAAGKTFPNETDARAWIARALVRRSKLLGREIEDVNTFLSGPRKRQPMTAREDIERQNWRVPMPTVESDNDPFDDIVHREKRETRKDLARKARADYEQRTAHELPPSKEVESAREWAFTAWEVAVFSDHSTEFEVERATHLKRWAFEDGSDLTDFNSAASEFATGQQAMHDARAADIQARRAALGAELAALPSPIVAPGGLAAGAEVKRYTRASDGATVFDVLGPKGDGPGRQVLASYPESESPAEVVAAAH